MTEAYCVKCRQKREIQNRRDYVEKWTSSCKRHVWWMRN